MNITGLHHITLVCADAQRTVDFYTQTLGQRFIKRTVNFDDPRRYHLYFGDEIGRPGTAITFFEWPGAAAGRPGVGGTHHFALTVPDRAGLLKWKRRLSDLGTAVRGPFDRNYFTSIYFNDPDGTHLEIATAGPGFTVDEDAEHLGESFQTPPAEKTIHHRDEAQIRAETWPEPVESITTGMALRLGMHHISAIASDIERTDEFLSGLLGLRLVKKTANFEDTSSPHWYWSADDGTPGTIITYFGWNGRTEPRARMGSGQTHHYAFAVPDDATQLEFRERLVRAGLRVSPVMDRIYFHSIYTNDPDGHIVELATANPGFTLDEPAEALGVQLRLPPWLEAQRVEIERGLRPLHVRQPAVPGPVAS